MRARGLSVASARAMAPLPVPRSAMAIGSIHRQALQRQFHQQLGFRAGNQGIRRHVQIQRPEFPPTQQVGDGLAGQPAFQPSGEPSGLFRFRGPFRPSAQVAATTIQRRRQQHLGVQARGVAGLGQSPNRGVAPTELPSLAEGWRRSLGQCRQLVGLILVDQRLDDGIEIPFQNVAELVEREVDAVIGDAPLREVVGADALGAIAAADQLRRVGPARLACSRLPPAASPAAATWPASGSCAGSARPDTPPRCRWAGG
jgi:hypothetical protein